jgi:predicted NACHT family NTPase
VELAGLDSAQVDVLVANWLDSDPASLALFREQLVKTPELKGLMGIPLLGTLIIAVFRQRRSLPDNKLKLYEVFIELMCGGWDLAKNVRRDTRFGSHMKLSILTRLAGQLHINGRRDAQEENIRSAIEQTSSALKSQWQSVLDEVLGDGLLVRAGANAYLFSHLSFQEYLAATELPDPQGTLSQQALKSFLRGDDWWREALTFYVSLIKHPDETEAWIKRTVDQIAGKGFDLSQRYEFLMEALAAAWPGWSPKKAASNI